MEKTRNNQEITFEMCEQLGTFKDSSYKVFLQRTVNGKRHELRCYCNGNIEIWIEDSRYDFYTQNYSALNAFYNYTNADTKTN